jgi:ribonuclease J
VRLRIHRGAREIGGNCVELEHDGHSILLDLGLPLDADVPDPSLLPPIPGLLPGSPGGADHGEGPIQEGLDTSAARLHGVVVSHIHPDHIGLTGIISPEVPVYLGEKAARLLGAAQRFLSQQPAPHNLRTYSDRQPVSLGPFEITPFLVDHSAFDAYAFLIEAGGRRVFYSGDLRAHGRKAAAMERLMRNPPSNIDALILEGTTLSRPDYTAMSETMLEQELLSQISDAPGIVFATFSAQNIDRFVSFYKATIRAGRVFVGDVYLAHILRAIDLASLPQPDGSRFRVYLPRSQRRRIIADKAFDLIEPFRHARIFIEELAADPSRFVMLFRESMVREVETVTWSTATLIYSMWPGYLDRADSQIRSWCDKTATRLSTCHVSGHADEQALVRFAKAMGAVRLVPIHSEVPHRFREHLSNVVLLDDGRWLEV